MRLTEIIDKALRYLLCLMKGLSVLKIGLFQDEDPDFAASNKEDDLHILYKNYQSRSVRCRWSRHITKKTRFVNANRRAGHSSRQPLFGIYVQVLKRIGNHALLMSSLIRMINIEPPIGEIGFNYNYNCILFDDDTDPRNVKIKFCGTTRPLWNFLLRHFPETYAITKSKDNDKFDMTAVQYTFDHPQNWVQNCLLSKMVSRLTLL